MRLIDADKLKRTEGMFQYQINDAFDRLSASAYRFEDVENAPTVEAIPMSYLDDLSDKLKATDWTAYIWLRTMIDIWREENG